MNTEKRKSKLKSDGGLKSLGQKFKWFLFTELQDLKLTSNYINMICPDSKDKSINQIDDLRNLIKQSLVREFTPSIEESKSFDLLVDAIMFNLQKKTTLDSGEELNDNECSEEI